MSETTPLPPAVIDATKFGDLINLPRIHTENQLSAIKAKEATDKLLALVPADFKEADPQKTEELIAQLAKLQGKLDDTVERQQGKRKPYTAFFSEIVSLFTT